jgi:methylation protein EvaC
MTTCSICSGELIQVLDFGQQPLANGFLDEEEFENEFFYHLNVGFCQDCRLAQLLNIVDKERLFGAGYPFYTGSSDVMSGHFQQFASSLRGYTSVSSNPFVVEIGSNDGTLLKHAKNYGFQVMGIEPAANVAADAIKNNIPTYINFFDMETAREIKELNGFADIVLATNCMCHIEDLHSTLDAVVELLSDSGTFIFEDPYLSNIMVQNAFDQFYDEHVYYFSVTSISRLLEMHGLKLFNIESTSVHGGSMRYFARQNADAESNIIGRHKNLEPLLISEETFDLFWQKTDRVCSNMRHILQSSFGPIPGYAATSKSTTFLNYCKFNGQDIPFIADTTEAKVGKYSPGSHIPIVSVEDFLRDKWDYAVLFAWNHRDEIVKKEKNGFLQSGTFISYIPEVRFDPGF